MCGTSGQVGLAYPTGQALHIQQPLTAELCCLSSTDCGTLALTAGRAELGRSQQKVDSLKKLAHGLTSENQVLSNELTRLQQHTDKIQGLLQVRRKCSRAACTPGLIDIYQSCFGVHLVASIH